MRATVLRLLLPLLLLAQVGLGVSPGRVLCIAASCCGHDAAQPAHHHHHHDDGVHAHHDHGAAGLAGGELAASDPCDCHFHIAMPDDVGGSRERSADRLFDLRLLQPAVDQRPAVAADLGASRAIEAPPPWTFAASDQCRARDSMRLLI